MNRTRYTVVFERGDRPHQWLAAVKELPHCHTYGHGIVKTRAHIREALAVWVGDAAASTAELVEELPRA